MTARNRTMIFTRTSGPRWVNNNPGVLIGAGLIATEINDCSDQIDVNDCFPFYVEHRSSNGGIVNKKDSGAFSSQFRDYICDYVRQTANPVHLGVSGVPTTFELATNAAARTNPSRPVVDVPVNILDIRPGIQSIRSRGEQLIDSVRRTGGRWLNWSFMIRPLVSDIVKMININDQINRRVAEIDNLYDGNGIRRTVKQGTFSTSSKATATCQSAGVNITREFDRQTSIKCSTHCRWKPMTRCGLRPSPSVSRALAVQAVQGMTIDFSTLWEIMPWSWMLDWFGNVGEYLKSQRNIIPARLTGVHPMKHTYTRYESKAYVNGNVLMSPITLVRETKQRWTSSAAPVAHFGFLNGTQMGILSALAASRL
jgi:hypothetical protein